MYVCVPMCMILSKDNLKVINVFFEELRMELELAQGLFTELYLNDLP